MTGHCMLTAAVVNWYVFNYHMLEILGICTRSARVYDYYYFCYWWYHMCYCYIIWWWPHERAFAKFIGSNLKYISSKFMWFSCKSSMTINCITIFSFREFLSDNIHYWPHSTLLTTQFMQLDVLPLQSKLMKGYCSSIYFYCSCNTE